jgi:hypothetical protein
MSSVAEQDICSRQKEKGVAMATDFFFFLCYIFPADKTAPIQ